MHILNYQNMLPCEIRRIKGRLHSYRSSRLQSGVRLDFDEVIGMHMVDQPYQIGVEHKRALEHTDNKKLDVTFFLFDLSVVIVNLVCKSHNGLFNGIFVIEESEF